MPINLEMPKLSDTMTEGTVIRWLKSVGDTVEIGDEVAEIETDKATMAMEAFDEGTLAKILVEEGSKAPVGSVLAVILEEGETLDDSTDADPAEESATEETQSKAPSPKETASEAPSPKESPAETAPAAKPAPAANAAGQRLLASPLAKKMAADLGVDLATVAGTGPGGRIVKVDIEQAAASPAAAESPTPTPAAPASSAPAPIAATVTDGDERVELSSMRRIIAERLLASKTTIPHFYLHMEVDAAPLMEIRKQINAQAEITHGNKYTVNDFILKALINGVQAVPAANASFNGDHIVQYGHIGVAVAVAVDDGLVTPVVKNAAEKSLLQISREVKDLAARAREGKLLPNEFDGGTITISNLGAYGVDSFDAIVNPPQAAILSVGAIVEKPVAVKGELQIGLRMNIGLSGDHRVVDGAVGAQLLGEVKKLIENPALMLV